jgi:N-terminal acetyltransferase B complex non-catalytic subunit
VKYSDRNWVEFLSLLDGTFSYVSDEKTEADEKAKEECTEHATKSREFLAQIAEKDGSRDRSASLALLELESRAKKYNVSPSMFL